MAEIRVERGGPTIWPWVLGLLLVALLIWGATELFDGGDTATQRELTEDPVMPNPNTP